MSLIEEYRSEGYGFIKWCEDNVCIPIYPPGENIPRWTSIADLPREIHPVTGKSSHSMWLKQQEEAKKFLEMDDDGRFLYRLIVLCWMRGESKSFLVCLVQLWKFFCFPKQLIVLGANSKDQVKFVHFEVMKDIVKNSPNLLKIIGMKNIQEKEIRMRNKRGDIVSFIRPLSSFSGIVSNITGYTFSEIFAMKNPKFFSELHGSIRAVPNALGTIDSTVSTKTHFLYNQMYKPFVDKRDKTLYFSYRSSPEAKESDFWNPEMTQQQLDSYKSTLPSFDQFFRNTWESAAQNKLCSESALESCKVLYKDGRLVLDSEIISIFDQKRVLNEKINSNAASFGNYASSPKYKTIQENNFKELEKLAANIEYVPELMGNEFMDYQVIGDLADIFNTDFVVQVGLDRADPMKTHAEIGARTILSFVLKGMYNSRTLRNNFVEEMVVNYIYIPIGIFHIESSLLGSIQEVLLEGNSLFGIDSFCSERWGVWDMIEWLNENAIPPEVLQPTYERQKAAFTILFEAVNNGRFKVNFKGLFGHRGENLLEGEFLNFSHDVDKRVYVSEQKKEVDGVQDDLVYSLGWSVYGGRELTPEHFREMKSQQFFGMYVAP